MKIVKVSAIPMSASVPDAKRQRTDSATRYEVDGADGITLRESSARHFCDRRPSFGRPEPVVVADADLDDKARWKSCNEGVPCRP